MSNSISQIVQKRTKDSTKQKQEGIRRGSTEIYGTASACLLRDAAKEQAGKVRYFDTRLANIIKGRQAGK